MAWLVGTSTWGNIDTDLAKLICGEINDSLGNNAGTDKWTWDISTSYNAIRTPSALDLTLGPVSNRAGYWALQTSNVSGSGAGTMPGATPYLTSCLQVHKITNTSGAAHGRVFMTALVTVANTVANNYSTARIKWRAYDPDANSTLNTGTATPNATGVATLYNGITVKVGDPSGLLPRTVMWFRGFTGTFLYGIDAWPFYPRRTGAPSFSTAPPGTTGTDYALVDQVTPAHTSTGQGAYFSGLGIKTATGCTGVKYTVSSITVAQQKLAIIKSTTAGVLGLIFGPAVLDAVNGTVLRPSFGIKAASWLKCAKTPATVTSSMGIQYWIAVKPTGITIVLNGDTGYSGRMGSASACKLDNVFDATYDVMPWVYSRAPVDNQGGTGNDTLLASFAAQRSYFGERRCQDTSWGARDWQTGWMRTDFNGNNAYQGFGLNLSSLGGLGASAGPPYSSFKPGFDGYWWFYGLQVFEALGATLTTERAGYPRGQLSSHFAQVPATGWGNGDEITDSVSGHKWMLVTPDFPGLPGRVKTATNTYKGGTAIRENL